MISATFPDGALNVTEPGPDDAYIGQTVVATQKYTVVDFG